MDDETPICEWLVYCMRRAPGDHTIFSSSNGAEAFELILREQPDLVFTDIRMPGMDGLELMCRVKERLPSTAFAILSNYAEFAYAKQALSMGALEYYLKSELRAADIEAILQKVGKRKEQIFSSGCIDLYNFYRHLNDPEFSRRFWQEQGMLDNQPYLLLCISNGKNMEEWTATAQKAAALHREMGGFAAAASEPGYDYLILQRKNELQSWTAKALSAFADRGGAGQSLTVRRLNEFSAALKQANCAKKAAFFFPEARVVRYETLQLHTALDRRRLAEERRTLLDLIAQRRYLQAAERIAHWFASLMQPPPEDVDWAIDACRRMVMSVEEQFYRQQSSPAPNMELPPTAAFCQKRCAALLEQLQAQYAGRCSPSIAAALEYIHSHYAEPISMVEVAQHVYRAPEYFSRQFKEEVGENFNTYLTLYRLDRAQELLTATDLRIGEIAERVGYGTPGYFSRIYKRYKGITPEQARKPE